MRRSRVEVVSAKIIESDNDGEVRHILKKSKLNRPFVKTPNSKDGIRRGRGWNEEEVKKSEINLDTVRRFGIIIDKRRKSIHEMNVCTLKDLRRGREQFLDKNLLKA